MKIIIIGYSVLVNCYCFWDFYVSSPLYNSPVIKHIRLTNAFSPTFSNVIAVLQLLEDIHERQKQESTMKEDLDSLKGALRTEKQYLEEIICERDKLRNLCDEKDTKLQVIIF